MDLLDRLVGGTVAINRDVFETSNSNDVSSDIESAVDVLASFSHKVEKLEDLTGRLTFVVREVKSSIKVK